MADILEEITTDAANITIATTGGVSVLKHLSKYTTQSSIKKARRKLHEGMNVLDDASPDMSRETLGGLVLEHDKLLARVDQLEKDHQTPLKLLQHPTNALKPLRNQRDAFLAVRDSTTLKYKIRRSSDVAKSARLAKVVNRGRRTAPALASLQGAPGNDSQGSSDSDDEATLVGRDVRMTTSQIDVLYNNPWEERDAC
ncbi:hypothetical protein BKA93DRAFT_787885, partial [Sparassis latifolia]